MLPGRKDLHRHPGTHPFRRPREYLRFQQRRRFFDRRRLLPAAIPYRYRDKPVDWFKVYLQGQDAQEWNSDRPDIPGTLGAEGDDNFDLRQAYVQIGPKAFNVTLGRQVLAYGDERLIGPGEWNNITKTWDAARLQFVQPKFSVDLFAGSVVNIYRDSFDLSDLFNGSETHRDVAS